MDYIKCKSNDILISSNKFWKTGKAWMRKNPVPTCAITMIAIVILSIIAMNFSTSTIQIKSSFPDAKDYANEKNGGRIVGTPNTLAKDSGTLYLFGFPVIKFHADPKWIINNNGKPFTFIGKDGTIIIELGDSIEVTNIQIASFGKEHTKISKMTSPKIIDIYVSHDDINYKKLTTFMYNNNGESMQTIEIDLVDGAKVNFIKIHVKSNWGADVTNLHSIKVFGK